MVYDMLGDHTMWYLYPVQMFTLIPRSYICTCTLYPLGFEPNFCNYDCSELMQSRNHLPRIEHCESLSFWSSFCSKLFSIFILVRGKYRTRGESCVFSLEQFWRKEKVHVVLCAVVLFCRQSILCQYCTSILSLTVELPSLSLQWFCL